MLLDRGRRDPRDLGRSKKIVRSNLETSLTDVCIAADPALFQARGYMLITKLTPVLYIKLGNTLQALRAAPVFLQCGINTNLFHAIHLSMQRRATPVYLNVIKSI